VNTSDPLDPPLQGEPINLALRDHQAKLEEWNFHHDATALHLSAERMIVEFKLKIPVPCLLIKRLSRRYGHFHRGRNGFGLKDEIAIDEDHIRNSPFWRVCGTLLHELLHSWQEHHGDPSSRNYHNGQLRRKAASLGLVINKGGHTQYQPGETPFFSFLQKHGIEVPAIPPVQEPRPSRRGSKLKLFMCPCEVKVRVGRSRFHARCLDCGGEFALQQTGL